MSRIAPMIALVVAGELAFGLPFNTARFFRPTLLDVFGFSNTQLGDLFAVYGVAAMLAYFPGGALADRFSARSMMSASLFATAAGGLYMATIPDAVSMGILYGYWGFTTIFLFWAALIKATRDWGGDSSQGIGFGILEGGRGFVAAVVAFIAVTIFASYMPDNISQATAGERENSFRLVILLYTLMTFLAGVLVWFAIPPEKTASDVEFNPVRGMRAVLGRPIVWIQAAIIVCAYCGYKGLDNYSLYAVQVLGMDEVEGARLSTYGAYTRPVAALLAGIVADRFDAARSIAVTFGVLCVSYGIWSMAVPEGAGIGTIYINFVVSFFAVYALRGIYFALLHENRTPKHLTGAAVGMVSLVGYTPDVFFASVTGRILDANPGLVGFQNYFMFLSAIAVAGVVAVFCMLWLHRNGAQALWPNEDIETK